MTKEDILRLRDTAEQTKVQFKERVTRDNKYDVSCEMVAGSGITRALKFTPDIKFVNDETLNEFVVMVERKKSKILLKLVIEIMPGLMTE